MFYATFLLPFQVDDGAPVPSTSGMETPRRTFTQRASATEEQGLREGQPAASELPVSARIISLEISNKIHPQLSNK